MCTNITLVITYFIFCPRNYLLWQSRCVHRQQEATILWIDSLYIYQYEYCMKLRTMTLTYNININRCKHQRSNSRLKISVLRNNPRYSEFTFHYQNHHGLAHCVSVNCSKIETDQWHDNYDYWQRIRALTDSKNNFSELTF